MRSTTSSWFPDLDEALGPLFWRIASALAQDIRSGRLGPGEQLPTHRALADALGVTVGTVTKAYAEAEQNGLVVSRTGRGTYVKAFPEEMVTGDAGPQEMIDLSSNVATTDTFDPVLNRLLSALSRRRSLHGLLQQYPYPGVARHRTAGARWIARRGIDAKSNQVILCNGGQEGLQAALSATARAGDTILTEKLNYAGLRYVARSLKLNLRGVETDEHGLVPDALAAACQQEQVSAILVTPTNHNPTNAFAPLERRKAIVEIAERTETIIVEDDIFGHLTGHDVPTLTSLAPDRCIYVCGLSKSIAAGLRVGYILAPSALVSGVVNCLRTTMYSTYPALMSEIATSLIETGQADKFVAWHREEARTRQELANKILGLKNRTALPSYHLWLPLPERRKTADFMTDLRERNVLVSPAEKFAVDHQPFPNAVRLALGSTTDRDMLRKGLHIIAECYNGQPARIHNTA